MARVALIYDFDKTLAITDMQNFKFIPNLGMSEGEFWSKVSTFSQKNKCEKILAYLYVMMAESKKQGHPLTEDYLKSLGKYCQYYPGVTSWFNRINQYGKEKDVEVEHYIISSGNREILKGTEIAKYCNWIFACSYVYDEQGEAVWPNLIINYTTKTQCLFRISKGVLDILDDDQVNKKTANKHVDFDHMIYIGDGITDIPCMALIKERSGLSIAVYKKEHESTAKALVDDNRVDASCVADYSENSKLENVVKAKIDLISLTEK